MSAKKLVQYAPPTLVFDIASAFKITQEHLEPLLVKFVDRLDSYKKTTIMVADAVYESYMTVFQPKFDSLQLPKKRCYVETDEGQKLWVRLDNDGFLYAGLRLVHPMQLTQLPTFESLFILSAEYTNLAAMAPAEQVKTSNAHVDRKREANATGNHYRNHHIKADDPYGHR
jgi:hypothetical protein